MIFWAFLRLIADKYRMETVKTVPSGVSSYVDNCGIDDITPADCEGMTATAVVHHGIFENPFAEEGTEAEPGSLAQTAIIDHVIHICGFPADSVMVKYIDQQQWLTLSHVTTVCFAKVDEFYTVRDDGITFEVTLMVVHIRRFKAFLLYYHSRMCWVKVQLMMMLCVGYQWSFWNTPLQTHIMMVMLQPVILFL
jgi:hypothetical protein